MPDLIVVSQHNSQMNWSSTMLQTMYAILGPRMLTMAYEDRDNKNQTIFEKLDMKAAKACALGVVAAENHPTATVFFPDVQSMNIMAFDNGNHRLIGYVHGGPYEEHDAYSSYPASYHRAFIAQLDCLDEIWVSTAYHRDLLYAAYGATYLDKISVVGIPVAEPSGIEPVPLEEKDGAIFVSRKSADKGYDVALEANKYTHIRMARFTSRSAYYTALAGARVAAVPSRKETFGLVAAEAFLCGTLPAIPEDLCYPELYGYDYPGRIRSLDARGLARSVSLLAALDPEEYQGHVAVGAEVVRLAGKKFSQAVEGVLPK